MDNANSVRNPFVLVSALLLMLIQTKNECDGKKREAEKWKKDADLLKQEIKRMKNDGLEKSPSINDNSSSEWIRDSSLSLLNQQQMTLPNFDAENPYFETCGIRISLRGQTHPESETIQHSLPRDLEHFNNLRREMRDFDKKIIIGGLEMNVHKDLLSSRIPYFKNLFTSNWKECSSDIIYLSEFDSTIMESFINWAYTGVISINLENVQDLIRTASYLIIESIVDECYIFMRRRIQFDDALPLLHFCRAIDYNKNDEYLIKFIESNFLLVSYTPDFLKLSFEDLVYILKRNRVNVDNDNEVLEAVCRWVGYDERRKKLVPSLLKSVECIRLSSSFLADVSEKKKWVLESTACMDAINKAQEVANNSLISLKNLHRNGDYAHNLILVLNWNDNENGIQVNLFDPIMNKWHKGVIEYREIIEDLPFAVVDNRIYFIGRSYNAALNDYEGKLTIYDSRNNQWNEISMPTREDRRRYGAIADINGIIYMAGGDMGNDEMHHSLLSFDPSNPSAGWKRLASMKRSRVYPATCVLNGKLFVIGGHEVEAEYNKWSDGEVYDPMTNNWTTIADMPEPKVGSSAASFGGELYLFGGGGTDSISLMKYSPATDSWTNLRSSRYASSCSKVVACDGSLIVLGWRGEMNRYDPSTDSWTEMESMSEEGRSNEIVCVLSVPASFPSPNVEKFPTTDIANE